MKKLPYENQDIVEQLTFDSIFDEYNDSENDTTHVTQDIRKQVNPLARKTFPIHLVLDFDQFMEYLGNNTTYVTATNGYLARKHLQVINELLSIKAENTTNMSQQEYYPYIHFFYHLALAARLVEKAFPDTSKPMLRTTERWDLYQKLTDTEKYFFLLETFWVDTNWAQLQNKTNWEIHHMLPEILRHLTSKKSAYRFHLNSQILLARLIDEWHYFLLYFEWFGFWHCEKDQDRMKQYGRKNCYFASSICLTEFGKKVIPILMAERNIEKWNITLRRQKGEVNPIPGSKLLFIDNKEDGIDRSSEPFFQAFLPFNKRELHHTLPRNKRDFVKGVYTFKVSFSSGVWRKVTLSSHHTMEDLHQIILRAYQFDDDHLYSFFMDGKKWSNDCIVSPGDDGGSPTANKVTVGNVGMHAGYRFLYLYDYGDEWKFTITVEKISETEPEPATPCIIASKGEGPEQYFY